MTALPLSNSRRRSRSCAATSRQPRPTRGPTPGSAKRWRACGRRWRPSKVGAGAGYGRAWGRGLGGCVLQLSPYSLQRIGRLARERQNAAQGDRLVLTHLAPLNYSVSSVGLENDDKNQRKSAYLHASKAADKLQTNIWPSI
jgi:hypothetical protein